MNILITGASGLVGSRLTTVLQTKGHRISHLSRRPSEGNIQTFGWDIERQHFDAAALTQTDAVVHLAGENVGDGRWTAERRRRILESRTLGSRLLVENIAKQSVRPKVLVAASGVGFYGADTADKWLSESSPLGNGFLAEVTQAWEHEVSRAEVLGVRVVYLRIGVVLSKTGGALEKIAMPIRFFCGAAIGSGQQYLSWIHLEDLCAIIETALQNANFQGVYNAVAPSPATNADLTKAIAQVLRRPVLPINVPAFALETALGEMSSIVLGGNRASCQKLTDAGYRFLFPELLPALTDLLR
jgi:uncharacterized protein (TIGR01777 family)